MRSLIFIMLAGYAVRCDDTSYYVIEMPEETQREYTKPFRVYWNVPTMQCKSKKIPFEGLYEKYGIIQNNGDSFRGEKVVILYDPGLFPALLKNETSKKLKFRNGGVPQEGDLEKHLEAFTASVEQGIPDKEFNGIAIIDFESWRPVYRQNFGVLVPYKDVSYQIEKKLHWFWSERALQARARQRFEEAARAFMQSTISSAKRLRPRALWGYYGFPYCFNMATNNMAESCADKVPQENNKIHWLWSESTALYPSVYSSKELTSSQLAGLIRGRVAEAARLRRRGTPVLPYFWFRYRDGDFLSQTDLDVVLTTLYKSEAAGFLIWGSSNDVNTVEKCNKLLKYTTEVLGPAIAKYTKPFSSRNTTGDSDISTNSVSSNIGLTTWRPVLKDHLNNPNDSKKPVFLDPEYHWEPPENYTHDIVHYVEQEFKRKPGYDNTKATVLGESNKNLLIEMILNFFGRDTEIIENDKVLSNEENISHATAVTSGSLVAKLNDYTIEPTAFSSTHIITKNPLETVIDTRHDDYAEGRIESDAFVSSTMKMNTYLTVTSSPFHSTRSHNLIEKENESAKIYDTKLAKYNGYSKVHEIEQLSELLSLESNLTMSTTNYSTDKPIIDENHENSTILEQLAELLALGRNLTSTTVSNISSENKNKSNETNQLSETAREVPKLLSVFDVESITETISSTKNDGVTSTSHDFSTVPLSNKLEDNISTVTYEELFNDYPNETTSSINENVSTTDRPISTEDIILNYVSNDGSISTKTTADYIYENNLDRTESSKLTDFEWSIFKNSYDTSTINSAAHVVDFARENSAKKGESDRLETETKRNTITEYTESTESNAPNETESSSRHSKNIPDRLPEESTTELTSSTTEDVQVVVYL